MIFLISFVFVSVFGSIFVFVFVSVNEIDFYPFLPIFVFVFVNENYTAPGVGKLVPGCSWLRPVVDREKVGLFGVVVYALDSQPRRYGFNSRLHPLARGQLSLPSLRVGKRGATAML